MRLSARLGHWTRPSSQRAAATRVAGCLYAVRTRARVVALTIDDGPDAATTPDVLRVLAEHDARATFFLISSRVAGNESVVEQLVAGGHELGNHLTRDEPSIRLTPPAFDAAVRQAGAVIGRFGPVRWLRPGSGWYNRRMLESAERLGYRCALGSVYPLDAHIASPAFAAGFIRAGARPGAVVVLHDGGARGQRTVATLSRVLPALQARGYRVVTLSELARLDATAGATASARTVERL